MKKLIYLTILLSFLFSTPALARKENNPLSITRRPTGLIDTALPEETPTPLPSPTLMPNPEATPNIDEAIVTLNHMPVIKIYGNLNITAEDRVEIIEERLEDVIERTRQEPVVQVKTVDDTPVLESEGIYIISVTNEDAESAGTSSAELAARWRDNLEDALRQALWERSNEYGKMAVRYSIVIIISGFILTAITIFISQRFFKRTGYFEVLLIWLIIIFTILWLSPSTRLWAQGFLNYTLQPAITLFIIIIVIRLLLKPIDIFVDHYFKIVQKLEGEELEQESRGKHKLVMRSMIVSLFIKAVLIIAGGIIFIASIKIDLLTGLTGAGIVGVALGMAAQDLIKDIMAGFLIVLEDQFAVGDYIITGGTGGTVEDFNLRTVRLRNLKGVLIIIPNSSIRTVENYSSSWSQFDCIVRVDYDTDLEKAMDIMMEIASELKKEKPDKIIDAPVMLGVDELAKSEIKLRMLIKTAPLMQWSIEREFYLRLKKRFEKEDIKIPVQKMEIKMSSREELNGKEK